MPSKTSPPRVRTREKYGITFVPYLHIKDLPLATPTLHMVAEVIADVADPDGCYCWLTYAHIGERARNIAAKTAERAVATLVEGGVLRKITGQERLDILDRVGARYKRKQPPTLLELLIPASAYSGANLARVNLMRADRGLPPLTPENRPDITTMVGETKKPRSDKGKAAPQRRTHAARRAEAELQEQQPSLYAAQDLEGPPEDPYDTPHGIDSPGYPGLIVPGTRDYKTPNPYELDPVDADPDSSPSVGAQPQGGSSQFSAPDGADEQGSAEQDDDPGVRKAGGDAPRPAGDSDPAPAEPVESPVPPTAAELLVDQLLSETARLGAVPLGDPVQDRRRLVTMAQDALDRGMTPMRLREIASAGLHHVQRQWALATRLSSPETFAQGHWERLGGTPMGGRAAAPRPRCLWHPNCTTLDARDQCAECAEAERMRSLAAGEIVEYSQDADGVWRDHTGAQAKDADEFKGLTPDQMAQELATRDRMQDELASRPDRVHAAAAAARQLFAPPTAQELLDA